MQEGCLTGPAGTGECQLLADFQREVRNINHQLRGAIRGRVTTPKVSDLQDHVLGAPNEAAFGSGFGSNCGAGSDDSESGLARQSDPAFGGYAKRLWQPPLPDPILGA